MKTTLISLLLAAAAMPAVATAATDLDAAIRALPKGAWLAYAVPSHDPERSPCCFEWESGEVKGRGCTLDAGGWTFSDDDALRPTAGAEQVIVYLRRGETGPDRVRAYGADCPIDTSKHAVTRLTDVDAARSVAMLTRVAEGESRAARDDAIGAIAMHGGADADRVLDDLAGTGHGRETRKNASFWLGQTRGQHGFDVVARMFANESDLALRKHWVFVLAQSEVPARAATLRRIARDDASPAVRGDALFWMSQQSIDGVEDEVRRALHEDKSEHVRKQAVFALSQLKNGRAVPALKALLADQSLRPSLRKEALFWLAQTDDDEAVAVFDDILR